jgi:predicted PolB exonuclease-like 3'-5' exonuclease
MLREIDLNDILFLDIETVPGVKSFDSLDKKLQDLWEKKSSYFRSEEESASDVYERAGIYAEFGKIICISVGVLTGTKEKQGLRIKSFADNDEKKLLVDFIVMLENYKKSRTIYLCAHNGKEFDFPYLARRILVNRLVLPEMLDIAGKKPWEVRHLDTMELWKFGDYKHYTSLELLSSIFEIPSPKTDIDGSKVANVYWEEGDLQRIVEYCQNDVITIVQILMRYTNNDLITTDNIELVKA